MKDNIVFAGIIGFGYMGHFHLKQIKNVSGIEILGVYDSNEEKMQQAREEGLRTFDSSKLLLNEDNLDLVIICTPNDVHCQYALEALKAKKNVLCEKPATMNVEEMKLIKECAEKNGRIFTTHQNRRWDLDYQVVSEVLKSRVIGEPTTIISQTFGQRGVCFGWRAEQEKGGGMLYDWGIHLFDQLLQLFHEQKIVGVYARLRSILTPEVDDYFEVELEFDNECVAHVSVGTFALQDAPRWYIFGDRGTLRLDDFSGEKGGLARIKGDVRGFERVKSNTVLGPSRTMAPLAAENLERLELPKVEAAPYEFYENLIKAIKGEEAQCVTVDEIVRDMEVVDAAFLSNKTGKKIETSI